MKHDARGDATKYRSLLRRAKAQKASLGGLLGEAKQIKDPYFAALGLFDLSGNPSLEQKKAVAAAETAIKTANRVESQWRRAEVLGMIARKLDKWRGEGANKYREKLLDDVLGGIFKMPDGKGMSDAIAGCAAYIGCNRMGALLKKAVSNRGFETEDTKAVIRHWAKQCKGEGLALEDMIKILDKIENDSARSKLLGYLHLQCRKSEISIGTVSPLHMAVDVALKSSKEERLDVLRYLAKQSFTREDVDAMARAVDSFKSPAKKARLLAALGAGADRSGLKEMAVDLFNEGLRMSKDIEDAREQERVQMNLSMGLERCTGKEKTKSVQGKSKPVASFEEKTSTGDLLALYDAYEGGLKPVHARAVARAAPLCKAFGLDLALMGFPTDNLEELIKTVAADTKVGRDGKYLKELAGQGRVVLVPCTEKKPPENWEELGLPVATTSRPKADKKVDMAKAVELSGKLHPLKRICIIMGLGKRGLPQSLLDEAPYHLELTGVDVPLETATAMGIIAQQLAQAR